MTEASASVCLILATALYFITLRHMSKLQVDTAGQVQASDKKMLINWPKSVVNRRE